jgi:hypothetical protein
VQVRELTLVEERKEELALEFKDTENLMKYGRMPPPREAVVELAQSKALGLWDNRKSASVEIL